jgi:hypothetical protein
MTFTVKKNNNKSKRRNKNKTNQYENIKGAAEAAGSTSTLLDMIILNRNITPEQSWEIFRKNNKSASTWEI